MVHNCTLLCTAAHLNNVYRRSQVRRLHLFLICRAEWRGGDEPPGGLLRAPRGPLYPCYFYIAPPDLPMRGGARRGGERPRSGNAAATRCNATHNATQRYGTARRTPSQSGPCLATTGAARRDAAGAAGAAGRTGLRLQRTDRHTGQQTDMRPFVGIE